MEKKMLFALLFCLLNILAVNVSAKGTPGPAEYVCPPDTCTAPPPTNFHVTGFGYGYVSLAWTPVSAGANHRLSVYEQVGITWNFLYSVYLPNSISYTVSGLDPQILYGFSVSTVCSNGLSGPGTPILGPTGIIVDLTASGFTPYNQQPVNCRSMPIPTVNSNDWIGFVVEEMEKESVVNSTIFEFEASDPPGAPGVAGHVHRVETEGGNVLVAANFEHVWPHYPLTLANQGLAFEIGKVVGSGVLQLFGALEVSYDLSQQPPTVSICPSPLLPWYPKCRFTPITGTKTAGRPGRALAKERSFQTEYPVEMIKVQNPSSGQLNVFFPSQTFLAGNWSFQLESMNGAIVFQETIDVPAPSISIPYRPIPFGLYVLSMTSPDGQVQRTKVIVAE